MSRLQPPYGAIVGLGITPQSRAWMGNSVVLAGRAIRLAIDDAGLKKDVLWAGSGKYAELWDSEQWKSHFATNDDERAQISSRLAELGL